MDEKRRKALAAALGLPEDASKEQIAAALGDAGKDLQGAEGGEPDTAGLRGDEVTPGQQPNTDQTPPGTAPTGTGHNLSDEQVANEVDRATENQPDPDAPDTEAGFVKLDKETYERLNRGAQTALAAEERERTTRRKDKVEAAIKAGKIPPSRREHYGKLMAADEEGTTQLLDSLAASAVPMGQELGSSGNGDEDGVSAGQAQGLPDEWFPDIAAKRAAVLAGTTRPVTHAKEG